MQPNPVFCREIHKKKQATQARGLNWGTVLIYVYGHPLLLICVPRSGP